MKRRFKEFYEKATGKSWTYDFDPETAELFGLLIVKECAGICLEANDHDNILRHFGVDNTELKNDLL